MKTSFWQNLNKPIIGLSPMDGVTDQPFRYISKKYGNPDVIYTEFTNVEGLCHGATQLLRPLIFDETQRPIVAQIFGKTPKYFRQVAVLLCEMGFDGIDINMGCPAKSVASHGSGAALILTPKLAQEIILETKAGVEDFSKGQSAKDCPYLKQLLSNSSPEMERTPGDIAGEVRLESEAIPVSVKTRIGYDKPAISEWISALLETKPAAIALHGRTLKQQYSGEANWEEIAKAANLVNQTETLILGNGDVKNISDAKSKAKQHKLDGVLIGRAALGNPLVFSKKNNLDETERVQIREGENCVTEIALEHARVFEKTFQNDERYNFLPMRKHLGWYIKGIKNAKEVRLELMQTNSSQEVERVLKKHSLL